MRITKISVTGLFGMFDHEIPLNQESRITIVHGPNGVGKTVLLRMVHGLFHLDYAYIGRTPFERLDISFENGAVLYVKALAADSMPIKDHDISSRDKRVGRLLFEFIDETGTLAKPPYVVHWSNLTNRIDDALRQQNHSHFVRLMHATGDTVWYDRKNMEISRGGEILHYFPKVRKRVIGKMPRWFNRIRKTVSTDIIHIERLREYGFVNYEPTDPEPPDPNEPLNDFEAWYFSGLDSALNEIATNIVSASNEFTLEEWNLFENLINERCLFKTMRLVESSLSSWVNYTISFWGDSGSGVPLSALSSGEQHLLVLYYQLIFETEPDTLVMIDEPELSMNVVWQRNFLKDLQRIIELRKFDVLIATHSPQIIHDKWDWMVPLGEKIDSDGAD